MSTSEWSVIVWLVASPLMIGAALNSRLAGAIPSPLALTLGRILIFGAFGLALWTLVSLLVPMPRWVFLTFPIPLGLWWLLRGRRHLIRPAAEPAAPLFGSRLTQLLFLPVIILAAVHAGLGINFSIVDSDEALIWNLKAKKIAAGFGEAWEEREAMPAPHEDYPLLNPLLQNAAFRALGKTEHRICRIPIQMVGLGLLLLLVGALPLRQRRLSPLFALPLVVDGLFWAGLRTAYADHLVAAGLLLYLVERARYHRDQDVSAALAAGLAAAFAAAAKNEGSVWIGIFLLAEVLTRRPRIRDLFLISPALAVVVAGRLANYHFGFESDIASFDGEGVSTWGRLRANGLDHMTRIVAWWPSGLVRHPFLLVLPVGLPLLAYAFRARAFAQRHRSVTLGICITPWVLIAVYLVTPHDLEWHLSTSAGRVMFQLLPAALFWLAGLCERGDSANW